MSNRTSTMPKVFVNGTYINTEGEPEAKDSGLTENIVLNSAGETGGYDAVSNIGSVSFVAILDGIADLKPIQIFGARYTIEIKYPNADTIELLNCNYTGELPTKQGGRATFTYQVPPK